jgi:class 3 adenylate cyclase
MRETITEHDRPPTCLPHHRSIVAVDIEHSTRRTNPVKAELRRTVYELFDAALRSAGIQGRHRDGFIDRGDGILALIHPVDQAPKALLLTRAIPTLHRLLFERNHGLPFTSRLERQLRLRVVMHAGEVHYDSNGCFGEALDIAFRLLDAAPVKKTLLATGDPMTLVVSEEIHKSVICHEYDGIDQRAFRPLVRVKIAGHTRTGWIQVTSHWQPT